MIKKQMEQIEREKNKKIRGIVTLDDLLSGEYHRRKEEARIKREKRILAKKKMMWRLKQEFVDDNVE